MVSWTQKTETETPNNDNQKNNVKTEREVNIVEVMKHLYNSKVLPLEKYYFFDEFHSPPLESADFEAKPTILMVGQYSTGKTTFIKYLLERDYPGIRIGPEPTTDRFIAVMYNKTEGLIPGNALVIDSDRQFRPLAKFGNAFLNRLQISETDCPVLESITFVDTPGILSGEKQRIDRGYDFPGVLEYFAERVDRIVLLFDANKLDISDEMKRAIESLAGNDHKIRIVLNKADAVTEHQLMRVYGALMWSLAKVLKTPEAVRIYIGSFWDRPLEYDNNRRMFETEEQDLLNDLMTLPRDGRLRQLNDLIKRTRLVKLNALIINTLKKQMPFLLNKKSKQKDLIQHLDRIYKDIQNKHFVTLSDFPNLKSMQNKLKNFDFSRFRVFKQSLFDQIDRMFVEDIPKLMSIIALEQMSSGEQMKVKGGKFDALNGAPFGYKKGEGVDAGSQDREWIVAKDVQKYHKVFTTLNPIDGKTTGAKVKAEMVKSKLPNSVLNKIYRLSDVDRDGLLDSEEFSLAMHLMQIKLNGHDLPLTLPQHLIPPSKRVVN